MIIPGIEIAVVRGPKGLFRGGLFQEQEGAGRRSKGHLRNSGMKSNICGRDAQEGIDRIAVTGAGPIAGALKNSSTLNIRVKRTTRGVEPRRAAKIEEINPAAGTGVVAAANRTLPNAGQILIIIRGIHINGRSQLTHVAGPGDSSCSFL